MTYIILAAGKGVRAKTEQSNIPKVLLKGIDGKSLLENTLEKIGFFSPDQRVNLVTGYLSEKVNAEIDSFIIRHQKPVISLIKNEIFERGVITSLFAGIKNVTDDIVILNGDTVYPTQVFSDLANIRKTTLLISPSRDIPDAVRVLTEGSKIIRVGKNLTDYSHISIGCLYVNQEHVKKLVALIHHLMETENEKNFIWHELINFLIESGENVQYKVVPEGCTIEVDTQEDYKNLLEYQRK